jgi:hypothetical protein
MCHLIWLFSRKYGTVWYHPASSKLWYLTALSFVNFQEKIDWHVICSLRVWSQLCSACCVIGVECTFRVNSDPSASDPNDLQLLPAGAGRAAGRDPWAVIGHRRRRSAGQELHGELPLRLGRACYPVYVLCTPPGDPESPWRGGCWRKICTLRQAHNKPNKLASHANRFQDVPVNFPWKLTKDKVVKFQSLELAGWYQTVPNSRLEKPCEMTYSYKKLSASKLETIRELEDVKQSIAERMTQAWR